MKNKKSPLGDKIIIRPMCKGDSGWALNHL
jgi:hypothetical protein